MRVAVRAAGVNFRDVLIALGMYPDGAAVMGSEGAGVVVEVGAGVDAVASGDRVMGLFPHGAGTVVVTDARLVVGVPSGVVVGAGRWGFGGVFDGLLRAGGSGRGAGGAVAAGSCLDRWGGDGGGGVGSALGGGGFRHCQPR